MAIVWNTSAMKLYMIARVHWWVHCGVTKTIKNEIKKQKDEFLGALLAPLATSLVQPVIPSVDKGISERGVRRAGRGYLNKNV